MEIERGAGLVGRVLLADGRPAKNARVLCFVGQSQRPVARTQAGADGRFELGGLAHGRYRVRAVGRGRSSEAYALLEDVHVPEAATAEVVLSLRPPSAVRGRLVREDGKRAGGAGRTYVSARPESTRGGLVRKHKARVEGDGTFTLTGLEDGRWTLRVQSLGGSCDPVSVLMPRDAGELVELVVRR